MKKPIRSLVLLLFSIFFIMTGCTSGDKSGPVMTAKLVPDDGKTKGALSIKKVAQIAQNRTEISCVELSIGHLYAFSMHQIGTSKSIRADAATRMVSGAIGTSALNLIKQEQDCHCDLGVAMPGYEIFERRRHLMKNKNNRKLDPAYANHYPKDENGKPRFLEIGEKIDRSVLEQLPPAEPRKRIDDCRRSCKASRKKSNEEAVAQGKPEPWPNLEYPRKQSCEKS